MLKGLQVQMDTDFHRVVPQPERMVLAEVGVVVRRRDGDELGVGGEPAGEVDVSHGVPTL